MMPEIAPRAFVLAAPDFNRSAAYFRDVFGFHILGTDKLTGFHAALSNGGVGSNIHAKRYGCVGFGVAKPNAHSNRR